MGNGKLPSKVDLDALLDRVNQYKQNRSSKSFEKLLIQVDNLLVYLINKIRKNVFYLQYADSMDLYQEAVEVLGEVVIKLRNDFKIERFPLHLERYLLRRFEQKFRYLKKEIFGLREFYIKEEDFVREDLEQYVNKFKGTEQKIFKLFLKGEFNICKIARTLGISHTWAWQLSKRIKKKLGILLTRVSERER